MVQPWIKKILGLPEDTPDDIVQKKWEHRINHVCKPCWELKYCPYGPLVEDFPLHEDEAKKAIELGWYSKFDKDKGWVECDKDDPEAMPDLNKVVAKFGNLNDQACEIFGHICPVFLVSEPLTESSELRKVSRNIPRTMFLRIVRRDNQTCQICGRTLKEDEIEIDHIIPFSKGGPTEEGNLRVLCETCNRKKKASVEI